VPSSKAILNQKGETSQDPNSFKKIPSTMQIPSTQKDEEVKGLDAETANPQKIIGFSWSLAQKRLKKESKKQGCVFLASKDKHKRLWL